MHEKGRSSEKSFPTNYILLLILVCFLPKTRLEILSLLWFIPQTQGHLFEDPPIFNIILRVIIQKLLEMMRYRRKDTWGNPV